MNDRRSGPSQPSWKNSGGGGQPSKRDTGPKWKKEAKNAKRADRPNSRKAKLIRFAIGFAACFGAIVFLIFQLFQPRPAYVSLIGADYAETLAVPHNVTGLNVLRSIQALTGKDSGLTFWGSRKLNVRKAICELGSDTGWQTAWKTEINDLHRPFREKTLVIYLALHGAVDPVHGAYLIVGTGQGESSRLPLKDVIASMAKFPKDKQIVLILDAAQVEADWSLGIVANDFAAKLLELKPEIEAIPNLWLLASCDGDQRSWPDRDGKTSLFGKYVLAGLDGQGAGETGRVNLGQLFKYVDKEVRRQATESWGASQTPILISKMDPKAADQVQINVVAKSDVKSETAGATAWPESSSTLNARWLQFEALSSQVPTPAVYAPRSWTEYRELMVRLEALARSHHPVAPERLLARLDDLTREMEKHKLVELKASERMTLAMPALTGRVMMPPKQAWKTAFAQLWNTADVGIVKAWEKFISTENRAEDPWIRSRLFDGMLETLAQGPGEAFLSLQKIDTFVQELRPSPRSAEVHFAVMLARHFPDSAKQLPGFAPIVPNALAIRRKAERSAVGLIDSGYSYSEKVAPWIRSNVEEGDAARRRGEDLLFSSEPDDWARAAGYFTTATTAYVKADQRAAEVRKAFAARDQALADLPFLSRWAVRRLSVVSAARDGDLALADSAEKLWGKVHELADLLDQKPADSIVLTEKTSGVEAGLDQLNKALGSDLGDLLGTKGAGLPPDWDLAAALDVPILRSSVDRLKLVSPRRSNMSVGKGVDLALRNHKTRLEARMAMAALGSRWFDRDLDAKATPAIDGGPVVFGEIQARLESAVGVDVKDDRSKRIVSLAWVGDQIGRRWRELPAAIDKLADGLLKVDSREGLVEVQLGERLERLTPGSARPNRSPAVENRRRGVHDVLVDQAGRDWRDHWFSDEGSDPHYLTAGLGYLNDAKTLAPSSKAVATALAQLNKPGKLAFDERPPVSLTSEASLAMSFTVHPEPGADVPPGFAVAWVEPGPNLQVVPATRDAKHRRVVEFGENPKPVTLTIGSPLIPKLNARPTSLPKIDPSNVAIKGFYRGQAISRTTGVGLYPVPEVTMTRVIPTNAGTLTVRADEGVVQQFGEGNGAIAIILDCSGSMQLQNQKIEDSKYRMATNALKEVLRNLPSGTLVSIWIYGEAGFNGNRFDLDGPEMTNQSIQRLLDPIPWSKGDEGKLSEVMRRVEALVPWSWTPLVRTMRKAKEDLQQSGRQSKTLLVLTDGKDEGYKGLDFRQDVTFNPKAQPIHVFLREEFAQTGIRVNMVFFKTAPSELKDALDAFSVVREFQPPGFIVTTDDVRLLVASLLRGANQKILYRVEDQTGKPIASGKGEPFIVSGSVDADDWHIPALVPGVYRILVETDRILTNTFSLDSGDRLVLKLGTLSQGGLGFRRGLASEDFLRQRNSPPEQGNGWRLAVPQSKGKVNGPLQMLASIERTTDLETVPLSQPKPRDVWIEVTPSKGLPAAGGLSWGDIEGYPAPSYAIDALSWPLEPINKAPANPTVEAWWSTTKDATPSATLKKGDAFDGPLDDTSRGLSGRTVQVDDQSVVIESVTVEENNTRLVVRIRHEVGQPVFIRLDGIKAARQEHRFYAKAGKYTGVFSDTNRDEVQTRLAGLSLISVNRLKREAAQRNEYAKVVLDAPPAPMENRPDAIPLKP